MSALRRLWFPLALLALLVAALPGAAVFALDVLGYGADVNPWLEQHFGLSHAMALPLWAAGVLAAVPPVIVLLYFLKLKRKPAAVSSTFLWRKSIEDLRVNRLLQWLRRNILLVMQLLAVLLLLYAVLGPRLHGRAEAGRRYILALDHSASMSATEQGTSRLQLAQAAALREIGAAADGDVGMVLAFAGGAEIRQSFTSDRDLLRLAVRNVGPTEQPTRLDDALALAGSLANPLRSTDDAAVRPTDAAPGQERTYVPFEGTPTAVHVFSDGRFPDVPDFALANLSLRYHPVGTPGAADNVAVTGLDAVRDEAEPERVTVDVEVRAYRDRPTEGVLLVDVLVDGKVHSPLSAKLAVPARKVGSPGATGSDASEKMAGEQRISLQVEGVPEDTPVVIHARLDGITDSLPLDDGGYLVLSRPRKSNVLIAGPGNPLLQFFFDAPATRAVADVTYLGVSDLLDDRKYLDPARAGAFDLVVFDRCGPAAEERMPRANTLFVGHPPPPWKAAELERVEFPRVVGWTDQHPVMRGLRGWLDLEVAEAIRLPELPPRTPRLLEGDRDLVLMAALPRGAFTDLVLAFPLETADARWNTRWFLKPLFPLFLRNLLLTQGNVREAGAEDSTRPGEVKRLRPGGAAGALTVEVPGGTLAKLERGTRAEFLFADTAKQGLYTATAEGVRLPFAVNLFDPDESNVEPRPAFRVGAETVAGDARSEEPRDLWKWLALLGLAAVAGEWFVYNRRVSI